MMVAIENTMVAISKDHYQCNLCEKSYSYPGSLKTHMLMSHSKVESYTCNQCDFLWISKEILKSHTQIHIKETSKNCNVCEFQCGTVGEMDEHIAIIHKENYVITDSPQAGILRTHLKTHGGEKLINCNQCDYASSQTGHLRIHVKAHNGEKLNVCSQCGFASSYASSLRIHLKTHSGEKSNKCNQCDFASYQTCSLRRHLKSHSGDKSNKCNQCNYSSYDAGDLRKHENTQWGKVKQVQPV